MSKQSDYRHKRQAIKKAVNLAVAEVFTAFKSKGYCVQVEWSDTSCYLKCQALTWGARISDHFTNAQPGAIIDPFANIERTKQQCLNFINKQEA